MNWLQTTRRLIMSTLSSEGVKMLLVVKKNKNKRRLIHKRRRRWRFKEVNILAYMDGREKKTGWQSKFMSQLEHFNIKLHFSRLNSSGFAEHLNTTSAGYKVLNNRHVWFFTTPTFDRTEINIISGMKRRCAFARVKQMAKEQCVTFLKCGVSCRHLRSLNDPCKK